MGEEIVPVGNERHGQRTQVSGQEWVVGSNPTQEALRLAAVKGSLQKMVEVGEQSQLSREGRTVGAERRSQLSRRKAGGDSLSYLDGWKNRTTWDDARWQEAWQGVLQHLDELLKSGKCGEALQYVATMIYPFVAQYHSMYKMGQQRLILNLVGDLARKRNTLESAFTDCQHKADVDAAQRALDAYNGSGPLQKKGMYKGFPEKMGMKNLLEWGEKYGLFDKAFVSGAKGALDEVFQGKTDAKELGEKWHSLWKDRDPNGKSMSVRPVTSALQNLASQWASQSAVTQSRIKFEESQCEQLYGEQHNFFSNIVKTENLVVSQMRGG